MAAVDMIRRGVEYIRRRYGQQPAPPALHYNIGGTLDPAALAKAVDLQDARTRAGRRI